MAAPAGAQSAPKLPEIGFLYPGASAATVPQCSSGPTK